MPEKDIVIIGGGPGGYVAAIHAAYLGTSVALVEKDKIGGTCLNRGCIPTKALVRSVEVFQDARRAAEFGVEVSSVTANFPKIMSRKNRIVKNLVSGIEQLIKMNRVSLYRGVGRIISPRQVKVNDEEIHTRKIIIATGSEPAPLPVPGVDLPGVYNTDSIWGLPELPESIIIIGGGYVGVEFASIFCGLGANVTIIEMLPTCLSSSDDDIRKFFTRSLSREGVTVKTGATVKAIRKEGEALKVVWDSPKGEQEATGKAVLLAAGRLPYSDGLGLTDIGIKMDRRAITVNDYLETNIEGIYAVGDVLGKTMLAHVASYQGEVAVENALGQDRQADYRAVPACIFTQPEIASVGITEKEAKEKGIDYRSSKFPFTASSRAATMDETTGFVKIICRASDDLVLGIHIIGPHASDLIAEGTLAIQKRATARDIAHTIHAHPTLSEAVREAAMGHLAGFIHYHRL